MLSSKSAVRPPKDADLEHPGLTVVVASSFNEIVLDPNRDVLILIWASWCHPCQKFAPFYAQIANLLKDVPNLVIAKMNKEDNDIPRDYFSEEYIPIVKLFKRGDKEHPILYDGEITTGQILQWLHKELGDNRFDLPSLFEAVNQEAKSSDKLVVNVENVAQFHQLLADAKGKLVVVGFFAIWCGPCRSILPTFINLSTQHRDVLFLKLDIDDLPDIANEHDVQVTPTFVFLKNGMRIDEMKGARNQELESRIINHKR